MQGIARLARELGISTGTVSRALNGKPDVNATTRERVLEAARRIGYAPNQAARALAQGQTQSVGFMIDLDRDSATSSDNFFMGVFDGVQSVLTEHGLDLLLMPCPSGKDHYSYLERFATRGMFDAMILASVKRDDKRIGLLQSARMPFVLLGRCATQKDYAWIDLDFETAVTTSLERMIALGHRRIAVTIPKGGVNFGFIFLETYQKVLARHGIAFDPALVFHTVRTELSGYEVMDALLGLPEAPIRGVLIDDLRVESFDPDAVAAEPVMACGIRPMRHEGIVVEHAELEARSLKGISLSERPVSLPDGERGELGGEG